MSSRPPFWPAKPNVAIWRTFRIQDNRIVPRLRTIKADDAETAVRRVIEDDDITAGGREDIN